MERVSSSTPIFDNLLEEYTLSGRYTPWFWERERMLWRATWYYGLTIRDPKSYVKIINEN